MYKYIILMLMSIFIISACNNTDTNNYNKNTNVIEKNDTTEYNKNILADTLNIDINDRRIKFINNNIETLNMGKITDIKIDDDKNVIVKGEDNTKYKIILSDNLYIEAVLNMDTNEYVITSEK